MDKIENLSGLLSLIKIYKYLNEGLTDKSSEDYELFMAANENKIAIECDCCVCFSSTNKDTNPIVYCSGKKYLSIIQLQGCFPPDLLPSKTTA